LSLGRYRGRLRSVRSSRSCTCIWLLADLSITRARKPWIHTKALACPNRSHRGARTPAVSVTRSDTCSEVLGRSTGIPLRPQSAGDAPQRRIVADPQSQLPRTPIGAGATFPWVFIPLRHYRFVSHGWAGAGRGTMRCPSDLIPTPPRRKGLVAPSRSLVIAIAVRLLPLHRRRPPRWPERRTSPDPEPPKSASCIIRVPHMRGSQFAYLSHCGWPNEPDSSSSALIDATSAITGSVCGSLAATFPLPPYSSINVPCSTGLAALCQRHSHTWRVSKPRACKALPERSPRASSSA